MAGDLIKGEIPEHWEFTTLGEICLRGGGNIQTGPFGSQLHASDCVPVGVLSIMPTNIGENRILEDGIVRIIEGDANRLAQHRLRAGYSRRNDAEPEYDHHERSAIRTPTPRRGKTIAGVLGAVDDKIELNRRMNATQEAMARALFQSWLVDFDPVRAKCDGRPPAALDPATAALFPEHLEETALGHTPKGWEVRSLDKTAHSLNGLALQKYPPGDVLFSWSGRLEVELWCGGPGALNQHLFKVTSPEFPKWFYYLWTLYQLDEFRLIAADKATTMGHIQRGHLTAAQVLIPLVDAMTRTMSPLID